ncbi:competence/damage-inducible protein A [Miltoncostaea marina]|uniref:competence/damage-inducible protein A n=1 Tax=Miltoncostaea marina TaxID=2843215 RepID=UPI001C3E161E|nr:competence/damage-inducible protein A [Miltoncostaea marina]
MTAAVLVTGDEVLRGRIQERNAGLLARSLEARGVTVARVEMVGDDLEAIAAGVGRLAGSGVDLVCVSGGLGPTHDDVSMAAVARATGRRLVVHPAALEMVRRASRAVAVDPAVARAVQDKQASLPEGSRVLPPPGTAPGCALRHGGVSVVVLPGPPWELAAMWEGALGVPEVAEVLARATARHERVLRLFGVPESRLVGVLEGLGRDAWARLRVGICARDAELEVTVRARPADEPAAAALEELVRAALGDALFAADGTTVDEIVARDLVAAGESVAVAESCTGGGLGARLTALPGSSAYVLGGVIAYSNDLKERLLGVDRGLLERHGAVSAECARAMAEGARARLGSDWALSVTGVAGPGGGTPDKPVGLVHVGLAGPGGVVRLAELRRGGDREAIRARSVTAALHLLRVALGERAGA